MHSPVNRPCRSLYAAAIAVGVVVAMVGAAPAHAAGLQLSAIAGPDGNVPFYSAGGFGPTDVASPPGDTHRLFITTKDGYVYVDVDGTVLPTPVLDLHTQTDTFNEDGMFSIAFDPNYATNRLFYVTYSDLAGGTGSNLDNERLDAFRMMSGNPNVADPASQTRILEIPTDGCVSMTSPHYGGQLQFGPDGHLWMGVGDGSDGCGHETNALDLDSLHGKILRIDPQPGSTPDTLTDHYTVPSDNPLVGQPSVRPEIWAYGLRNPYRFSFDPTTHAIVIGDVGLSTEEEVDRVPSTLGPGAPPPFFGWPCWEGNNRLEQQPTCSVSQTPVAPLFTKDHGGVDSHGNPYCTAIIGGYVLDDPSLQGDFDGRYLYGFFCANAHPSENGRLFTTNLDDASPQPRDEGLVISGSNPNVGGFGLSSFGEDACGHPYAMNVVFGGLYRIEGPTPGVCGRTRIASKPAAYVASTEATFTFTSSVVGSAFTCSLDGATATPCTSPQSYSGLAEGSHTFTVTATNGPGTPDAAPATSSWMVETTPPQTTITSRPAALVKSPAATFAFAATEPESTFACSLDGAAATPCVSPVSYTGLADGAHTFAVRATNGAGTPEASPPMASWTVDTTPPDTLLSGGPKSKTTGRAARFTFSSSDAGATFACSLDGALPTACSSPVSYSGLSAGAHSFTVTATDVAGNTETTPASTRWTIFKPSVRLRFAVPRRLHVTAGWRIPIRLAALTEGGRARVIVTRTGRRAAQPVTFRVLSYAALVARPRLTRSAHRLLHSRGNLGVQVHTTVTLSSGRRLALTEVFDLLPPRRP